jgi:hypothetical protein
MPRPTLPVSCACMPNFLDDPHPHYLSLVCACVPDFLDDPRPHYLSLVCVRACRISEMFGYAFAAAKSNVWHKWDPYSMIYPSYSPIGQLVSTMESRIPPNKRGLTCGRIGAHASMNYPSQPRLSVGADFGGLLIPPKITNQARQKNWSAYFHHLSLLQPTVEGIISSLPES